MNPSLLDKLAAANPTADAAALLALASVPILTPRKDPITITALANAAVWGFPKAVAFEAALDAAATGNNAMARTLLSILRGPGFTATDPQVAALAGAFVALGGGTVTADDATIALNTISYPAETIPTLDDCTASLARVARQAAVKAINDLRFAADQSRAAKIGWLMQPANAAAPIPADLADLDAFSPPIPTGG